ncbi:HSP20-like chaperone [Penicillium coprophilum]|uniref:HSP20-like chaperone n=1 Tax=Penicillium coprophilum TaxID=36646 RepID=UPI002388DEC7|nr:HSP20-like chaperone [Penicillium coprophilum]KAJ5155128.1 HSP20-like chaperone [Penicillium coprophilum]
MSLLRANFPGSGGDFAPLFRLLDDYDDHRSSRNQSVTSFSPRFDIRESEDAYHFDGELPGISQKDIDIEFSDPQTLVVKGHTEREYQTSEPEGKAKEGAKKSDDGKPTHRFWASERSVGEFQRVFSFPTPVDQHNVKASLKNGILAIQVPKVSAASSKKITIE